MRNSLGRAINCAAFGLIAFHFLTAGGLGLAGGLWALLESRESAPLALVILPGGAALTYIGMLGLLGMRDEMRSPYV